MGRPNVGKSTLFNRLAGRRVAVVSDTPGTTRDRVSTDASWRDYRFLLVDTGGFEPAPDQRLTADVRSQMERAVDDADGFILVVDIKDGVQNVLALKHTISERSDGTQCTSKEDRCDENGHYERMIGAQNNVQPFIDLMNTNSTIICYINTDRNKAYLNNDPDWTNFIVACSLFGVGILGVLLFSECCGKCNKCNKDKEVPKKSVDDDDDMEKGCVSKLNCWSRQQDV